MVIETVNLVKNISPQTKTVATGHSGELTFLKSLAEIENLDLIGLNIWGIQQIDETTSIGKEIKNTINYVEQNGKEVVFEQTWSLLHDAPEAKKASKQEFMKYMDAKYVKVMAYYANLNNVSIYSPFYTGQFVYYGENPNEFKSALDSGQRTPVFYAYKDVISEFNSSASIPSQTPKPAEKSWLYYEGPIYETHPYYYDGTFKGLTKQIPSIADLGVKTIYLMPIWEQTTGSADDIPYKRLL